MEKATPTGGEKGRQRDRLGERMDFIDVICELPSSLSFSLLLLDPMARRTKLGLLGLIAIIYFEVSGGPVGIENAVSAGGPLLAILGVSIFPLLWSIPGKMRYGDGKRHSMDAEAELSRNMKDSVKIELKRQRQRSRCSMPCVSKKAARGWEMCN
jgi:hypothetical protein